MKLFLTPSMEDFNNESKINTFLPLHKNIIRPIAARFNKEKSNSLTFQEENKIYVEYGYLIFEYF